MLEVRAAASLGEVDPTRWDRLAAPAGFYLSHPWLQSVEGDASARAEYLLAVEGDALLGALPVYDVETEHNDFYRPASLVDGRWRGRYLLAGARRGYANGVLTEPGLAPARRRAVLEALLAALRARVTARRVDGALFLYLDTPGAACLSALDATGRPLLTAATTALDLPGRDFADYLGSRPGRNRTMVRKELAAFARSGLTAGEERLADCWEEAAPLLAQVQARYGHPAEVAHLRALLGRQAAALDRYAVVFSARDGGRLVGFSLLYAWGDGLYERMVGFDYARLRDAFEYFNLAVYQPLAYAYRHGLRRLDFGRESYEAKVLRGAHVRPLWSVAAFTPDAGDETEWNRRAAAEWRARLRHRATTFRDPGWMRWGGAPKYDEAAPTSGAASGNS